MNFVKIFVIKGYNAYVQLKLQFFPHDANSATKACINMGLWQTQLLNIWQLQVCCYKSLRALFILYNSVLCRVL